MSRPTLKMDNELELLDSTIEELSDDDDLDAIKEKYQKLSLKHKDISGKNRQLFERTKKAEGELKELKVDSEKPKAKSKSDEELLKRLDNLAYKTAGINEADEIELVEKWKKETGRETDAIIDNSIFKQELEGIRTAKTNQKATSDIKGEPGISGAKSEPDYWISKATKGPDGRLLFPEEMPRELYTKVLDKLTGGDKPISDLKFYNSPKVG